MTKIKRTYSLLEERIEKIATLAKEKNINYTVALELMIDSYFADRTEEHHMLKEELDSLLSEKFKGIDEKIQLLVCTNDGCNPKRVASIGKVSAIGGGVCE